MTGLSNKFLYSAKKIEVVLKKENVLKSIRGTGFIVQKEKDIILITNKHMAKPWEYYDELKGYEIVEFTIESYESFDENGLPQKINKAYILNWSEFLFHSNEDNDVACLKNVRTKEEILVNSHLTYDMIADKEWIFNQLVICDSIAYPGFSDWYDKNNNTPIFRMGTIASDPRLNYSIYVDKKAADRIAYEGFSTGGASGSPVFALQKGFEVEGNLRASEGFYRPVKLVGINAGHYDDDKDNHSGISYFYKASVIHDILD